jgi:uncharacterized protein YqgC (DUF456 family)
MDPVWTYYLWALLLVVACCIGWLLSLVTLPGNWLIVGFAALFAWLVPVEGGRGLSWKCVIALVVLAVIGEVIEFAAGAAGAAKQGASKRSVALSMIGAIAGSILGLMAGSPVPVIGSFVMALVGGALGAFGGAYLGEAWKGRPEEHRVAAGRGAFTGRIWGTMGKLAVGAVMVATVAWHAFL